MRSASCSEAHPAKLRSRPTRATVTAFNVLLLNPPCTVRGQLVPANKERGLSRTINTTYDRRGGAARCLADLIHLRGPEVTQNVKVIGRGATRCPLFRRQLAARRGARGLYTRSCRRRTTIRSYRGTGTHTS